MQSESAKRNSQPVLGERPKLYVVCARRIAETGKPVRFAALKRASRRLSSVLSVKFWLYGGGEGVVAGGLMLLLGVAIFALGWMLSRSFAM